MRVIPVTPASGEFAEDKEQAQRIRVEDLLPALAEDGEVVLDFEGVGLATQSFIHALLSDVIRQEGPEVLDRIGFKNCTSTVKGLISLVADYSQQGLKAESLSTNNGDEQSDN